jgi:hypothetical protein
MRKVIGSLFQSLDGVIQAPGGPEEDQTGFAHGAGCSPIPTARSRSRWGDCWAAATRNAALAAGTPA